MLDFCMEHDKSTDLRSGETYLSLLFLTQHLPMQNLSICLADLKNDFEIPFRPSFPASILLRISDNSVCPLSTKTFSHCLMFIRLLISNSEMECGASKSDFPTEGIILVK